MNCSSQCWLLLCSVSGLSIRLRVTLVSFSSHFFLTWEDMLSRAYLLATPPPFHFIIATLWQTDYASLRMQEASVGLDYCIQLGSLFRTT